MICVTIAPVSRKLAKADLLNAARFGDIIELRLDHLAKEPDVKDLVTAAPKPVIVSCRRRQDGGAWDGDEDARRMLLREAIVAGPAYIELDMDIAPRIPRFGKTQRIIAFTRTDGPEDDIESVFNEAAAQQADIVKFTWPTPTMDDAWPMLKAVSQKRRLPIVGIGLGRADLTFSLLGLKYGSPWIYAALERGMESYPGQATVFELDEIYRLRGINKDTTFIGVAGLGPAQEVATRILNAGLQEVAPDVRCLPIEVGDVRKLRPMLDALKIRALVVANRLSRQLVPLADAFRDDSGTVDLLRKKRDDQWYGSSALTQSAIGALVAACGTPGSTGNALSHRNIFVLGAGGAAAGLIRACLSQGGLVSIAAPRDADSQALAQELNCRFVPFHNVYATLADVAIIADPALKCGVLQGHLNPTLFKAGMTVLDASDPPIEHPLFEEARVRGCTLIDPSEIFAGQIARQFHSITGKDLPGSAVEQGLAED
jgi:3-dehydroquinate dehydratase/shikimate dehydrogenase